ncbi:MAG: PD-(D/E)XK nuclease family protein [Treponemataceae bacterium]|nr:PD-(D/E)XK nuclease family protein [Treponemataceae bacterium]
MRFFPADADDIPRILADHLRRKDGHAGHPLFVFPTDIAADSWSAWAARNPAESGVQAVALEDFTAWDAFKGAYLAGNVREKTCIPALLRKLFVRDLLQQNVRGRFITSIIPADDAETAFAFTDWLAGILPSLRLWHEKYEAYLASHGLTAATDPDGENHDYAALFARYDAFLTANGFFEPAWLTPEYLEQERTIVIFFPELLEDFCDYEEVLSGADNVVAVTLKEAAAFRPRAYRFPDSRTELRRLLLRLRELHERGARWTDIAVSVPDLETYRPYIRRECALYCIPVNIRSGEPLTKNCAGMIFSQIHDCYASRFSYDSVRALLQNEYVPWKADITEVRENLIREGNRLRTVCGYEDGGAHIDSWIEAMRPIATDVRELAFYQSLKHEVTRLCEAATFGALHTAWLIFRQQFLDDRHFTTDANNILGRCLSELNDIIDIETRYANRLGLRTAQPFAFFLNELNAKTYRPQEKLDGISVFPYRLAAAAHVACQFVIDASQKNLDVSYKKLGFLHAEKRKLLLGAEADKPANTSAAFLRLYAKSAGDDVYFSCAEETFAGFAIAHSALAVEKNDAPRAELDGTDFFVQERQRVRDRSGAHALPHGNGASAEPRIARPPQAGTPGITALQRSSFVAWAERTQHFEERLPATAGDALTEKVRAKISDDRGTGIVVTQSDLRLFYPCPRKWVLGRVLGLREESLDTDLMQAFDMGNVNHKVLELFMRARAGTCLPVTNADGVFDDEDAIRAELTELAGRAIRDRSMHFRDSPLVLRALDAQRGLIADDILRFLRRLCIMPSRPAPEDTNPHSGIGGFGGFSILGAETDLYAQAADGIALRGSIDCLLSDPETGDYVILDYKNTAGALPGAKALTEDEHGLLGDFQMPMYVTLAGKPVEAAYFYAIKDDDKRCAIDAYKGLSKAEKEAGRQNPRHYDVFMAGTVRLFGEYVRDFAARVAQGRFSPVNPRQKQRAFVHVEPHEVCAPCPYNGICRTTFTVGARDMPGQEDC